MKSFPKLYKRDTTGRIRIWWMDIEDGKTRTNSGLENGEIVTSGWKEVEEKNVGKKNSTTIDQQAESQVKSAYVLKQKAKHFYNKEDVDKFVKIDVMLASTYDSSKKIKFPCYVQPKLDGVRAINTGTIMQSRPGNEFVSVPHILEQTKSLFIENEGIMFDGELYNHEFKEDFNSLISMIKKTKPKDSDIILSEKFVQHHIYDIVDETLNFSERLKILKGLTLPTSCKLVETYLVNNAQELEEYYGKFNEAGYEGMMIRYDEPYEGKRSKSLWKRKEFFTEEFKLLNLNEGQGSWAGYVKTVEVQDSKGNVFSSGIRGNQKFLKDLLAEKNEYNEKSEVTIRFPNYTPDGIPRFPVIVAIYKNGRDM